MGKGYEHFSLKERCTTVRKLMNHFVELNHCAPSRISIISRRWQNRKANARQIAAGTERPAKQRSARGRTRRRSWAVGRARDREPDRSRCAESERADCTDRH